MINFLIRKWNEFVHTLYSTYLCIRFPFLYTRNVYTGLHYTNWKMYDKINELHEKAYGVGVYGNNKEYVPVLDRELAKVAYHILYWFHNVFLQIIFCLPRHNYLDMMPIGWRKAFGIRMCEDIKKALLDEGGYKHLYNYRIMDIKEKYGSLRWYDVGSSKKVQKIIAMYEYISFRTCIICGDLADGFTEGWISPYCTKCEKEENLTLFGTQEHPWYDWYKV